MNRIKICRTFINGLFIVLICSLAMAWPVYSDPVPVKGVSAMLLVTDIRDYWRGMKKLHFVIESLRCDRTTEERDAAKRNLIKLLADPQVIRK